MKLDEKFRSPERWQFIVVNLLVKGKKQIAVYPTDFTRPYIDLIICR